MRESCTEKISRNPLPCLFNIFLYQALGNKVTLKVTVLINIYAFSPPGSLHLHDVRATSNLCYFSTTHLRALRAAGPYEVHSGTDQLPRVDQQGAEGRGGKVERTAGKGRERTEHAEVRGQQVRVSGQQYLSQPLQTMQ